MSIWIILSWVLVAVLTVINVIVFLKLKQASEQMMKMAFPGAKNMNDALTKMQQMAQGLSRGPRASAGVQGNMDSQLKAAMEMLQKMQKGVKR